MDDKEIERRVLEQHQMVVQKVDNLWYPYLVQCSCNWQSVARSTDEAENYKNRHLDRHKILLGWGGIPQGHI